MKTIGIIGGIGPQATYDLEERIHKFSQKYIKPDLNGGYPPIFTYYMREAPVKIGSDGKPEVPFKPSNKLLEVAQILGKECDFLIIASNSPHVFQKEVEKASGKKILSIIEVVVDELSRRKVKKVGIMATGGTLRNGLYQTPLEAREIEAVPLVEDISKELDKGIFRVMAGLEDESDRKVAEAGAEYLREKGAEAIIIGCTEIPFLLKNQKDREDLINPAEILAEAAVKFAIA